MLLYHVRHQRQVRSITRALQTDRSLTEHARRRGSPRGQQSDHVQRDWHGVAACATYLSVAQQHEHCLVVHTAGHLPPAIEASSYEASSYEASRPAVALSMQTSTKAYSDTPRHRQDHESGPLQAYGLIAGMIVRL